LYGFADQYVESSLTAESYLNFVVAYTIGIGIVFQIPLLLLLLHTIKPFTPGGLIKSEKWIILIAFIIAAIITPTPDPVNQAIIAGPVIVVYQIGVVAVLIAIARSRRKLKATAVQAMGPLTAFETVVPLVETAPAQGQLVQAIEAETALISAPAPIETPVQSPSIPQEPVAVHTEPQQPKFVDGFMRRPIGQVQVPQRSVQPLRAEPRPVAQPQTLTPGPARGFYVDGIIAPRNPAIG
jgi:hypothetical protein